MWSSEAPWAPWTCETRLCIRQMQVLGWIECHWGSKVSTLPVNLNSLLIRFLSYEWPQWGQSPDRQSERREMEDKYSSGESYTYQKYTKITNRCFVIFVILCEEKNHQRTGLTSFFFVFICVSLQFAYIGQGFPLKCGPEFTLYGRQIKILKCG